MQVHLKCLTILLLIIFVGGCSKKEPIEQKPGAKYVVLTTTEPDPRACVYTGDAEVQAKSGDLGKAQLEVREKIKNKAIDLKGNTVMLDTTLWSNPGLISSGEVVLSGRIFKCDFPKEQIDPLNEVGGADDRRRRSGDASQQDLFDSVQSRSAANENRSNINDNNRNFQANQERDFRTNQGNNQNYREQNYRNNSGNSQYYQSRNFSDNREADQTNQEPDLFEDTGAR